MNDPSRIRDGHRAGRPRVAAALSAPGGYLLVLRAFLGVTFVYAGLQKLANPDFFSATAPGSFEEQLRGSIITSPLHHLLSVALHAPVEVAVLISLGEIAVGLGTLLGLFGRVAAAGGALLSLSFFLTVSFRDHPYYYGPDIVFLFAWTPFLLGGSGAWSLDRIYSQRAALARAAVPRPAAGVATTRQLLVTRHQELDIDRRIFLRKAMAASVVAGLEIALGALTSVFGRVLHTTQRSGAARAIAGGTTSSTSTTSVPTAGTTTTSSPSATTAPRSAPSTTLGPPPASSVPRGTRIGPAADVPVGGAASFTDPAQQVPALVVQPKEGQFRAFSAICPHAGCQVQFDGANDVFACPCHGSVFNAATGAVIQGPAATGLLPISIAVGPNGELYVDG